MGNTGNAYCPGPIRDGVADFVGGKALRLDRHSRHDGALGVLHDTPDSSLEFLCDNRQTCH